jgi:hypothetical protein
LKKYNGSPSQALVGVFPEYNWLPWKFAATPKNFWQDLKNQRNFMDWAGKQLNIKDMSDWYNVTQKVNLNFKLKVENQGYCRFRRRKSFNKQI